MSEESKELVRRHFEEIFNRKNLAVCDEIMAEDFVDHAVAPFAQAAPGRVNGPCALPWNGCLRSSLICHDDRSDCRGGDTVAVRVLSEGTNLGPPNGVVPPTGKRFTARQSHWFHVAYGKLVEHWATREDLPTMLQLGIIQPPGAPPS